MLPQTIDITAGAERFRARGGGERGIFAAMLARMRFSVATVLAMIAVSCSGAIDDGGGGDPSGDAPGPEQMVDIEGPDVLPHVQRFANAMCTATGACAISTYEGHHPSADRAIDIRVSDAFGQLPSDDNLLGNTVADYALAHQPENGIWYVIWRQRFNDGSGWDPMEDRGSITQNHYDHVHVSFNETAP